MCDVLERGASRNLIIKPNNANVWKAIFSDSQVLRTFQTWGAIDLVMTPFSGLFSGFNSSNISSLMLLEFV